MSQLRAYDRDALASERTTIETNYLTVRLANGDELELTQRESDGRLTLHFYSLSGDTRLMVSPIATNALEIHCK